ncbi:MAG TPA: peptide-methionine (S)-S-oxide reductase MsrA [Longimicrobiales bacterium]|nr:peptide-methionine (S)-S-oxide reductase MsrA [Longimicrobiales bacterium]
MRRSRLFNPWLAGVTIVAGLAAGCSDPTDRLLLSRTGSGGHVPPPEIDLPAPQNGEFQVAYFAGGCFWSVEAMFERLDGVQEAVSGFSGGSAETAIYNLVVGGGTEHTETVRVTYDPSRITYGQLLQIFFTAIHDPTQVDRQGPDVGRQYRSEIFYTSEAQKNVVQSYIQQLNASGVIQGTIATKLTPFKAFYPAEEEHQDFVAKNWTHHYVVTFTWPKLDKLRQAYPEFYREL